MIDRNLFPNDQKNGGVGEHQTSDIFDSAGKPCDLEEDPNVDDSKQKDWDKNGACC